MQLAPHYLSSLRVGRPMSRLRVSFAYALVYVRDFSHEFVRFGGVNFTTKISWLMPQEDLGGVS